MTDEKEANIIVAYPGTGPMISRDKLFEILITILLRKNGFSSVLPYRLIGGRSSARKEQLFKMRDILAELRCPQIIMISHERELESFADHIFMVNKTHNVSRISV